jgi:hypothetical protein
VERLIAEDLGQAPGDRAPREVHLEEGFPRCRNPSARHARPARFAP